VPFDIKGLGHWFCLKSNDKISNPHVGLNIVPLGNGIDGKWPLILNVSAEISKRPFHSMGLGFGTKIPDDCKYLPPITLLMKSYWVDSKHLPPWKVTIGLDITEISKLVKSL